MMEKLDRYLANKYFDDGEWEKGFEICAENPKLHDLYKKKIIFYGEQLLQQGEYFKVVAAVRKALQILSAPILYKYIGIALYRLEEYTLAITYLKLFGKHFPNDTSYATFIANAYDRLGKILEGKKWYENAIKITPNDFSLYTNIGRLYSIYYQFKEKDKQIYYIKKACELAPNESSVILNAVLLYCKFDMLEDAEYWFQKLLLNPVTNMPYFEFGGLLIRHKRFKEGFNWLRQRFMFKNEIMPIGLHNLWNGEDLSDKTVLITYEQGFGDTFMFSRFIPRMKDKCKKFMVVVQDECFELINDSFDFDVHPKSVVNFLEYDYYLPMMDLILLLDITPEDLSPLSYLKASSDCPYVENNIKFKIGISYEGLKDTKHTGRDIPLKYLYPLLQMENVDVYNLQKTDSDNQALNIPKDCKLINIGTKFKNWTDTAQAINCMDLIISSDNGIMNLAGALGVKTFGLFNRYSEMRWFTFEDTVGWYDIKPFKCKEQDEWQEPISELLSELSSIIK